MAARAAATGLVNPQMVAFNWFTAQMGLPTIAASQQNGLFFGLTPAHLVFMTILILVSIALLILQILRLHRVQEILNATRVSVPQPPSPPAPPSPMNNGPKPPVPPTPGSGDGTVVSTVIPPRQGLWRGSLKVARVIRETPAIATFYLVPADGGGFHSISNRANSSSSRSSRHLASPRPDPTRSHHRRVESNIWN
ncbi:hypothetical protein [Gluconobacter oxydans]|uniref:hypothetical protein n=1 Tax=Gluconobacter oxydans TaxID=442 RepID=UPI002649B429|nr:hypothetical protein [Gluconobacter oxydans]WKE49557.1 hypothetical protein NUJ38_13005 [Gluconobacter oxydans]